jgi:hypothetical protein
MASDSAARFEHLARSVLAARDEQPILVCDVDCALWFLQPRDRVRAFAGFETDDFHRVVAQSRNKQSLSSNVDRHVVDAALYIRQFDRLLQLQLKFDFQSTEGKRVDVPSRSPCRDCTGSHLLDISPRACRWLDRSPQLHSCFSDLRRPCATMNHIAACPFHWRILSS